MKKLLCLAIIISLLATQVFAETVAKGGSAPAPGTATPVKGGVAPVLGIPASAASSNYYYSYGPGTQWQLDTARPTLPAGWTTSQLPYTTNQQFQVAGDKVIFNTPLGQGQSFERIYAPGTPTPQSVIVNGGNRVEWSGEPTAITTRTTTAGETHLYYAGEQIRIAQPGQSFTFQTVDSSGNPTGTYTAVKNGAVRQNQDSTRDIIDSQGKVIASGITSSTWTQDPSAQQNIVQVAAELKAQGASLNDAKYVDGKYVYDSWIWGSDVVVVVNSDGTQSVTRGSLVNDEIDTTSSHDTTTTFNGQVIQRVVSDGTTEGTHTYQYSQDGKTWSVDGKQYSRNPDNGQVLLPSGVNYHPETGKYYDSTGKEITGKDLENIAKANEKDVETVDSALAEQRDGQYVSTWERVTTQGIFSTISQVFIQYDRWRGLGAYGSLFIGKEELAERRAKINEQFCKFGLGIDCIVEKLCESYSDKESGSNVLITVQPGAGVRAAAHVQAQRSEHVQFKENKSTVNQYLYTVTYYASSPDKENHVQLRFFYEGGTYDWHPEPGVKIMKGGAASAKGPAAIISYSAKYYTDVCLIYESGIETGTRHKKSRVCTPIVDVGATPSSAPATPSTSSAPSSTSTGTTKTPGAGF